MPSLKLTFDRAPSFVVLLTLIIAAPLRFLPIDRIWSQLAGVLGLLAMTSGIGTSLAFWLPGAIHDWWTRPRCVCGHTRLSVDHARWSCLRCGAALVMTSRGLRLDERAAEPYRR